MWVHCSCLQTYQKRASGLITGDCEPPCGCWDLNSEPSEEQSVLLAVEPSLQPPCFVFLKIYLVYVSTLLLSLDTHRRGHWIPLQRVVSHLWLLGIELRLGGARVLSRISKALQLKRKKEKKSSSSCQTRDPRKCVRGRWGLTCWRVAR
jgi:hypothetical protein